MGGKLITAAHLAGFTRLVITLGLFVLLGPWPERYLVATGVVIIAAVTDFLDGYLARKQGTVSNFGIYLDLTADKVFVNTALIILSMTGMVDWWITFVTVIRDSIIMGVRAYAAAGGLVLPARPWGKAKTFFLFAGLLGVLMQLPHAQWLLVISVVLGLISGVEYVGAVVTYRRRRITEAQKASLKTPD